MIDLTSSLSRSVSRKEMGFFSCQSFLVYVLCYNLVLLGFSVSSSNGQVPAMYVFGDSLVDVGNNDYLPFSILKANFPHNGVDYPGHQATGRFSNGKNAADFIAEKIGIPTPPAYLSVTFKHKDAFNQGVNFASGGAGVLNTTNKDGCITLDAQIKHFSTIYAQLVQGGAGAQSHLSKSIFTVVIGSNDLFGYLKKDQPVDSPQEFVNSLGSRFSEQLRELYGLGTRKLLVIGTGPIGCCPSLRSKSSAGDCNKDANYLSAVFSEGVASVLQGMASEFQDVKYSFYNSSLAVLEYIKNPANYGFVEVKAACCGLGNLNAECPCLPIATYCSNRRDHIFWDFYHPTEIVAQMLAYNAFDGSQPYASPINLRQLIAL